MGWVSMHLLKALTYSELASNVCCSQISKCLTLDPSNIDALLLQSAAETRLGLSSQSKESLKRCLEATGNSPPAVVNVAMVLHC